jgi:hypothetical protein
MAEDVVVIVVYLAVVLEFVFAVVAVVVVNLL